MYFAFRAGNTSAWNWAQCGQESEAYSTTFTLALGSPRFMSPGAAWAPAAPAAAMAPTRAEEPAAITTWRRLRACIGLLRGFGDRGVELGHADLALGDLLAVDEEARR